MAVAMFCAMSTQAQTTVLTEDFSGANNIFGITATGLSSGSAAIYDSGLSGYGNVLAVSNATATGQIQFDGAAVATGSNGVVTMEWDAFHGYYNYDDKTTVSLLNSDDAVVASYTYNANGCKIESAVIGGADVTFDAFSLQSKTNASSGANGWGGNGKPFSATAKYNPHIAVTLEASGKVTMTFTLNDATVSTLLGNIGNMKKDIARMSVKNTFSRNENTDRCYGLDNIVVKTDVQEQHEDDYIEAISSVVLVGSERMTFGPDPDTAYKNEYSVVITGVDGTNITEDNISEKVTDFNITWDIEGFKTANDTEGQYCDSYGAFSVNNEGKVATSFDLRDVPMNFFGRLTATVTYNGTTTTVGKYVVALGDKSVATGQVLPLPGYPKDFSAYPAALAGYKIAAETYGAADDLILGGWCVAGSDTPSGKLLRDDDGTMYARLTASALKKSHVLTKAIAAPTGQIFFAEKLRFNNAGATMTLTSKYPVWSSTSGYTNPVTFSFDGTNIKLNGTALQKDGAAVTFATGTWYQVVLSADKTVEQCYAQVFDAEGQLLAESGLLPWTETSSPTYFSIGMGNSNTGSVDIAAVEAFTPVADTGSYTLTADKTTLSIPNGESARLAATLLDQNGYVITQQATWTVVEEDMQQSLVITSDADDTHSATVTLSEAAEAGTATVQVSIAGYTKTLQLTLTSSVESIKFTKSMTSVSIPLDADETATATYAASVVDGEGNPIDSPVTLAAYDRDGTSPYTFGQGITFDAEQGLLTVTAEAQPAVFTIKATGLNSKGEELSKSVRVSVHGLKFDFGYTDEEAVAEGFTAVGTATTYTDQQGYGIVSGTTAEGGTASADDATQDYLQGAMQFSVKVQRGQFYTVEITYQGKLTTGVVNSDLAGYVLGTHETLATEQYTLPATLDVLDLHVADADATHVAQIAQVTITKQTPRQKRSKRVVHHIGDSTSANNGSWAYRLKNVIGTDYPELAGLCDFHNDGAGGRNLSTYYTEGKLAGVLRDIYPDDVVMLGNNGTNGMGNSFEADVNYYLDAAETLGAKVIINSYTPHGCVGNYASGYDASTNTFSSYRRDSYETVVRRVAEERAESDANYLGFVEIGKNADEIFNAYVADYAANGYTDADAAAQAIISCFTDHNHYSNGSLACNLMLGGYQTTDVKGIVAQMVELLSGGEEPEDPTGIGIAKTVTVPEAVYSVSGQRVSSTARPGLYIVGGRKVVK